MIPLPRTWLLTSAMLVGTAFGMVAAIVVKLLVDTSIRPDLVIGLVVGVPGAIGLLAILVAGRRWVTTVGAFVLAVAPGWLVVLVAIQVVAGD